MNYIMIVEKDKEKKGGNLGVHQSENDAPNCMDTDPRCSEYFAEQMNLLVKESSKLQGS